MATEDNDEVEEGSQSIFDLFEPPPESSPSTFGTVPKVRAGEADDGPDDVTQRLADAEAEAAGLPPWTAPGSGKLPAAFEATRSERIESEALRPSWQGDDGGWDGPDLTEALGSIDDFGEDEDALLGEATTSADNKADPVSDLGWDREDSNPAITPDTAEVSDSSEGRIAPKTEGSRAPKSDGVAPAAADGRPRSAGGRLTPASQPIAPQPASSKSGTDSAPAASRTLGNREVSRQSGLAAGSSSADSSSVGGSSADTVSVDGPGVSAPRTSVAPPPERLAPAPTPAQASPSVGGPAPASEAPYSPAANDFSTASSAPTAPELFGSDGESLGVFGDGPEPPSLVPASLSDVGDRPQSDFGTGARGASIIDEDDAPGRNIRQAAAVGVALGAVVLLAMALGPVYILGVVALVALLAVVELYNAMRIAGLRPANLLGIFAATALPLAAYYRGDSAFTLVFALSLVFGMLWYIVGADSERPVLNLSLTLLGVTWIGGLGGFAGLILRNDKGVQYLASTILMVVVFDTLAYFGGRAFGSRPFHRASPNKTWEGTLAGLGGSIFTGFALWATPLSIIDMWSDSLTAAVTLGALVGIAAPIGDLAESLVKRDLGIKDMGTILPGHGGVLDRIDGLLFALPVAYYLALSLRFVWP